MTTTATIIDQVCQFFGGAYDSTQHEYTSPTVAGLSSVRRAWAKREDYMDFFRGQPPGTMTGAIMIVQIPDTADNRIALPAGTGRRIVHYTIDLHTFIWSKALYVEDAQDQGYALRDALVARIRSDFTLGTGGIENNNFMVGEGAPGAEGDIRTHLDMWVTEDESTKGYLLISFIATAFDVA